jgi:crotonobetainyl-CoA:carnitine CoA-transferase CaiB-like acyl-CoA transferase
MSASSQAGFAPLRGIRIADFSTNMAGPHATMILAQLGADVIKIEPPGGDDARAWPPVIDDGSITHRHMNAGKRSLVIDLKSAEGQEVARVLAGRSHVLLQSMRPGVASRIGIGEEAVRARNPAIIYYDLSAFGSGAVGRSEPGYDPLVQAFSGIMQMTGHEGSPPARCAPSLIDLGTGQWIAMGVLAAVLAKERGHGVRAIETALVDTAFSLVPYQATTARMTGRRPVRAGSGNPIAAPYQCYPTGDGDVMIAAPNQRLWEKLAAALDAAHLTEDERFRTVETRSRNNAALTEVLTTLLATAGAEEWVRRIKAAGVPATIVAGLDEAVVSDVARERRTFMDCDGVPLVRLPWLIDGEPLPWQRAAPRLGEHSTEILRELDYSEAEAAALIASGAVRGATRSAGRAS